VKCFSIPIVTVLLASVVLPTATDAGQRFSEHLTPPVQVMQFLDRLNEIDSLEALPASRRYGTLTGPDGKRPDEWALAAPGGAWNATDVISDASIPTRRLVVGGCYSTVCVLNYQRGGVGEYTLIVALLRDKHGWKAVWSASGGRPLKNIAALRAVLENRYQASGYTQEADGRVFYY
jgi:hypothetical protein